MASNQSPWLRREEILALLCTLALTSILCFYLLYLRQEDLAERNLVVLVEYLEVVPHPVRARRVDSEVRTMKREEGRVNREKFAGGILHAGPPAAVDSTGETQIAQSEPSDSLRARELKQTDSASTNESVLFRPFTRSKEIDSILAMDPATGEPLLRTHVMLASQVYDTARTIHLIRLGNDLARFDAPVTLEGEMRRNMRRYGYATNPMRPQPPSAQIPLEGIVIPVLDFLFKQVKEIPAAISRVVSGKKKETP